MEMGEWRDIKCIHGLWHRVALISCSSHMMASRESIVDSMALGLSDKINASGLYCHIQQDARQSR